MQSTVKPQCGELLQKKLRPVCGTCTAYMYFLLAMAGIHLQWHCGVIIMDFCLTCLLSLDMDGCAHAGFVRFLALCLVFACNISGIKITSSPDGSNSYFHLKNQPITFLIDQLMTENVKKIGLSQFPRKLR